MAHSFDRLIDRRATESDKWRRYGSDVIPLWLADMDFASPEPVVHALRERVEHGLFGYASEPPELRGIIVDRLQRQYNWPVSPEALVFFPGVIAGFNLACRAVTSPGDGLLMQTPIYPPMLRVPGNVQLTCDEMELTRQADGRYEIDIDLFEQTITERTRIFLLCNPHNPVGRVYRRDELEHMAEICLRHGIVVCSDEIHAELVFPEHSHLPIASLDAEIANRTITLMAPSKTFNIPGLPFSLAIIENRELRDRFVAAKRDLVHSVGIMGYVAAMAAYRDGQPWLDELLPYLKSNRDFLKDYVDEHWPGIGMAAPEGTYLAWLDCREADIPDDPYGFFLREAGVALYDGKLFGRGGDGFVRLTFGCPRPVLVQALTRMSEALASQNEAKASPTAG